MTPAPDTAALADLRAKAEGATPGPWEWDQPLGLASGLSGKERKPVIEDMGYDGLWIHPGCPDAAYIAAANPATIISLLDALAASAAKEERVREALEPFADAADDLDDEPDGANIWEHHVAMNIDVGHLRAARTALSQEAET